VYLAACTASNTSGKTLTWSKQRRKGKKYYVRSSVFQYLMLHLDIKRDFPVLKKLTPVYCEAENIEADFEAQWYKV